ncbi:hypothetical protein H7849_11955 [Alloacidobacterium dinghuense]|uniref:Uncharacterized protein n=1 Tax=Alloacidobacterium dinghuense TaxID=2763107 RepID=A0A7G8BPS0_9BACT|nr:hypothetical protein [Alloacidobacterium dinghuense]QNI34540.1 hypothetical protein H7849_11955 [Alloacidobacterium dinghuense]
MATQYPPSLLAVGGARTGIAPVNLLDVEDINGNLYYWSDRPSDATPVITGSVAPAPNVTPPVPVPAGQQLAWAYATETAATGPGPNGGASSTLTSGAASMSSSGGLEPHTYLCEWQNFALPNLPPGAVIQAIYPVAVLNFSTTEPSATATWAVSGTPSSSGGLNIPGNGLTDFDGQFTSTGSIGSTAAAIQNASITCSVQDSLGPHPVIAAMEISFVALAVYYTAPAGSNGGVYKPWLLSVPSFAFHRSLQTDTGSFVVQNISGDTLSRDMEKIIRASALEGALFVYRLWQPDAEAAWLEVHGTLSVEPVGVDTVTLRGSQLINPSQDDTPLENYSETCQIQWAGRRCGSTQPTECSYSYQTCQVLERIMVVMNDYEKNYGEALANTAQQVINRRRRF